MATIKRRRSHQDSPRQRHKANARERDRTQSVNRVFGVLRRLIPTVPSDRRFSKIETLRLARSYIDHLEGVLRSLPDYSVTDISSEDDTHHRLYVDDAWIEVNHGNMERTSVCTFCFTAYHPIKLSVATALLPGITKTNGSNKPAIEFLF